MKVVRLRQRKVYQFEQVQSSHTYHPTDIHSPLPLLPQQATAGLQQRFVLSLHHNTCVCCAEIFHIFHLVVSYILVAPAEYDLWSSCWNSENIIIPQPHQFGWQKTEFYWKYFMPTAVSTLLPHYGFIKQWLLQHLLNFLLETLIGGHSPSSELWNYQNRIYYPFYLHKDWKSVSIIFF